jgi:hypothetical protein
MGLDQDIARGMYPRYRGMHDDSGNPRAFDILLAKWLVDRASISLCLLDRMHSHGNGIDIAKRTVP